MGHSYPPPHEAEGSSWTVRVKGQKDQNETVSPGHDRTGAHEGTEAQDLLSIKPNKIPAWLTVELLATAGCLRGAYWVSSEVCYAPVNGSIPMYFMAALSGLSGAFVGSWDRE